jgi:hypothetical protein
VQQQASGNMTRKKQQNNRLLSIHLQTNLNRQPNQLPQMGFYLDINKIINELRIHNFPELLSERRKNPSQICGLEPVWMLVPTGLLRSGSNLTNSIGHKRALLAFEHGVSLSSPSLMKNEIRRKASCLL